MLKIACTNEEISCIIGTLFVELEPPCKECLEGIEKTIVIKGKTYRGTTETLELKDGVFLYSGAARDITDIRKGRCLIK